MPPRRAFLSRQAGDQTSSIVTPAGKIQNPVIRRHYETLLDPVHGGPTIRSGKLIPTAFAAHEQFRDGYRLRCITGEQLLFDEQTGRLVSSWRFELVQPVKPRRAERQFDCKTARSDPCRPARQYLFGARAGLPETTLQLHRKFSEPSKNPGRLLPFRIDCRSPLRQKVYQHKSRFIRGLRFLRPLVPPS